MEDAKLLEELRAECVTKEGQANLIADALYEWEVYGAVPRPERDDVLTVEGNQIIWPDCDVEWVITVEMRPRQKKSGDTQR